MALREARKSLTGRKHFDRSTVRAQIRLSVKCLPHTACVSRHTSEGGRRRVHSVVPARVGTAAVGSNVTAFALQPTANGSPDWRHHPRPPTIMSSRHLQGRFRWRGRKGSAAAECRRCAPGTGPGAQRRMGACNGLVVDGGRNGGHCGSHPVTQRALNVCVRTDAGARIRCAHPGSASPTHSPSLSARPASISDREYAARRAASRRAPARAHRRSAP